MYKEITDESVVSNLIPRQSHLNLMLVNKHCQKCACCCVGRLLNGSLLFWGQENMLLGLLLSGSLQTLRPPSSTAGIFPCRLSQLELSCYIRHLFYILKSRMILLCFQVQVSVYFLDVSFISNFHVTFSILLIYLFDRC